MHTQKLTTMKKTIITSILVLLINLLHAQNILEKIWDYRFGGTSGDVLTCFQQTADGGYILGGYSRSGISGDKTQATRGQDDYWIVKIDSLGNKQWDKDFGGTTLDQLSSIQQTADGGYILGGTSTSGQNGDKTQANFGGYDYWIVKTDSLGMKQWDKDFGGTGDEHFTSLQQTDDGGYILGGKSGSAISGNKTTLQWGWDDYWIIKIDYLGNMQWDKDFGGTGVDNLYSLQQTTDGGYILGGNSGSGISGDKTQDVWGGAWTDADYWIIKIDDFGHKQWDKDLGGTGLDIFSSLQQTTDNGFILGGISYSGISGDKTQPQMGVCDYWIVKIDSLGSIQWDKAFGGTEMEQLYNVSLTTDSGYLIAGYSQSTRGGDKTENNLGYRQTWVVKTDSLGNKEWDKTIFTSGQANYGLAIQTQDGCYSMANNNNGEILGYKTQASQGQGDFWITKFCETNLTKADFVSDATHSVCNDTCIRFFSTSTNATSYQWSFPGATPSTDTVAEPQDICYSASGQYDLTLIVSNGTTIDTLTVIDYITIFMRPVVPVIAQTGDTLFTSQTYVNYQWYRDTSAILGAINYFYIVPAIGNYNVIVVDSNGCSVDAGIISVIASVESIDNTGRVAIFPNPIEKTFTIRNFSKEETFLIIINVFGNIVYSERLFGKNEYEVDANLANGIYFVRLSNEERNVVRKLIVK
jgi:hypothetical protein